MMKSMILLGVSGAAAIQTKYMSDDSMSSFSQDKIEIGYVDTRLQNYTFTPEQQANLVQAANAAKSNFDNEWAKVDKISDSSGNDVWEQSSFVSSFMQAGEVTTVFDASKYAGFANQFDNLDGQFCNLGTVQVLLKNYPELICKGHELLVKDVTADELSRLENAIANWNPCASDQVRALLNAFPELRNDKLDCSEFSSGFIQRDETGEESVTNSFVNLGSGASLGGIPSEEELQSGIDSLNEKFARYGGAKGWLDLFGDIKITDSRNGNVIQEADSASSSEHGSEESSFKQISDKPSATARTGTSFLQFPSSSGSSLLQVKLTVHDENTDDSEESSDDWRLTDLETWQKIAICGGVALVGLFFWYIFWKCTKSCYCAFWVIILTLIVEAILIIFMTDLIKF